MALENFGLSQADLNQSFTAGEILGIGGAITLKEIINHLEAMYCESIGVEYMYVREPQKIEWIQNWLNQNLNHPKLSKEEKERILFKLNQATAFENFLNTKYVGQKRFSVEGNESLIPGLDTLINRSSDFASANVSSVFINSGIFSATITDKSGFPSGQYVKHSRII